MRRALLVLWAIGLGIADTVLRSLTIRFPSGAVQAIENPPIDTLLLMRL